MYSRVKKAIGRFELSNFWPFPIPRINISGFYGSYEFVIPPHTALTSTCIPASKLDIHFRFRRSYRNSWKQKELLFTSQIGRYTNHIKDRLRQCDRRYHLKIIMNKLKNTNKIITVNKTWWPRDAIALVSVIIITSSRCRQTSDYELHTYFPQNTYLFRIMHNYLKRHPAHADLV